MSTFEIVGYMCILFFVLLYPLILLRYYVIREYVYFSPFLYGMIGGIIFYAIPYMYLKMFIGWDMSRDGIWLFIVLLAAVKALLGEGGKRLIDLQEVNLARLNNMKLSEEVAGQVMGGNLRRFMEW